MAAETLGGGSRKGKHQKETGKNQQETGCGVKMWKKSQKKQMQFFKKLMICKEQRGWAE